MIVSLSGIFAAQSPPCCARPNLASGGPLPACCCGTAEDRLAVMETGYRRRPLPHRRYTDACPPDGFAKPYWPYGAGHLQDGP